VVPPTVRLQTFQIYVIELKGLIFEIYPEGEIADTMCGTNSVEDVWQTDSIPVLKNRVGLRASAEVLRQRGKSFTNSLSILTVRYTHTHPGTPNLLS
jgi:pyridoxal biosynthesis lyase PdxS